MQQKVTKNWVTIGTGVIANELAVALESLNGKLYGVANRTYTNAVKFAEKRDTKIENGEKNMALKKYITRLMRYLQIRQWILFIFLLRITRIFTI